MPWQSEFCCEPFLRHSAETIESSANFSRLTSCFSTIKNTAVIGFKYVVKGREHYKVNNKWNTINEGEYLLVNTGQEVNCEFKSKTTVEGICIDLNPEFVNAVYADTIRTDKQLLDDPFHIADTTPEFLENVYFANEHLDRIIKKFLACFLEGNTNSESYDLYYELACQLIICQKIAGGQVSRINAVHEKTKKEIYSRLNMAKNYIDANVQDPLYISHIAREASLSEFHFQRSFKEAFGISPYKYIVSRRLEKSFELLKTGNTVTDVAFKSGYNDIYSFSKAFKEYFKFNPSSVACLTN